MASYGTVQNFSLPSRTSHRRPFSPFSVNSNNAENGLEISIEKDRQYENSGDRDNIYSPSPTALQMFQFYDDVASLQTARNHAFTASTSRPGARPQIRPLSTSSSAPALTTTGVVSNVITCPSQTIISNTIDHHDEDENINKDGDENANGNDIHVTEVPPSPTLSVWPSPPAAAAVRPETKKTNDSEHARHDHHTEDPPRLARSLSLPWGPRLLRHRVSLTSDDVQAADDAAGRVASLRRTQRVFWLLACLECVGIVSCTAAATLAATQAAARSSGETNSGGNGNGNGNGNSNGPQTAAMDPRTLGWLVASLVVVVGAAVGLAVVVTSARRKRVRHGVLRHQHQHRAGAAESQDRGSCSIGVRRRRAVDGDDIPRQWMEMEELGRSRCKNGDHRHWQIPRAIKPKKMWFTQDDKNKETRIVPAARGDGKEEGEEGRNWTKFARDPAQLRRYVETLEARLAAAEGVSAGREAVEAIAAETQDIVSLDRDATSPEPSATAKSLPSPTGAPHQVLRSASQLARDTEEPGQPRLEAVAQARLGLTSGLRTVRPAAPGVHPREPAPVAVDVTVAAHAAAPSSSSSTGAAAASPKTDDTRLVAGGCGGLTVDAGRGSSDKSSADLLLSPAEQPRRNDNSQPVAREEGRQVPGEDLKASATQESLITELYAAYGEERSPQSVPTPWAHTS